MSFAAIFHYLSQQGPYAPKHKTWRHPVTVCLVHYAISITMVLAFHDAFLVLAPPYSSSSTAAAATREQSFSSFSSSWPFHRDTFSSLDTKYSTIIANFVLGYFGILLSYRILQNRGNDIMQKACIYENTWLCNMTLLMGAIGLYTGREIMVMAHVITVSIDQVLWYLDVLGWLLFRKFPIGVAKYLTWPQTSFATRITCTHHLWTIPLLLFACIGNIVHGNDMTTALKYSTTTMMSIIMQRLDDAWIHAYVMSAFVMSLNVFLSRWMTPSCIKSKTTAAATMVAKKQDPCVHPNRASNHWENKIMKEAVEYEKYLNVNLSHALWKDIQFGCLQIQWDNPSTAVYLFRLLWRWQLFNGIVLVCVLRPLTRLCIG